MPDDLAARWSAIAHAAEGSGDLDAAVKDLFALPAEVPGRTHLAALLLGALMRANAFTGLERLRGIDRLLSLAEADPPRTDQWRRVRAGARAMAIMRAGAEQQLSDPRAALRELDALEVELGADPAMKLVLQPARQSVELLRALREGDEVAIRDLPAQVTQLREMAAGMPGTGPVADALAEAAALMTVHREGGDVAAQLDRLRTAVGALPPEHPLRAALAETDAVLGPFRSGFDLASAGRLSDADLAAMQAQALDPASSVEDRATRCSVIAAALLGAETSTKERVDRGIEWLRRAVALEVPDGLQRAVHLQGLALGLFKRSELTGSTADLDEAGPVLERAREHAGGPQHPQWAPINDMLAYVRRRRGGPTADVRSTALDGLRAYVWQVLVQSDLEAASRVAADAAGGAVDVARGFLRDNDPAGALAALDAGRGLALFAATSTRTVAARLRDAGHESLAAQWATASSLSGELRHEVLTALGADSLLDPPELDEVRDALATLDADALVYLVPGDGVWPGFAVTAPRNGPPGFVSLPNLLVDGDLDDLWTLDSRDLAPAPGDSVDGRLDTLCDWAWRAAIGPLLERYLPTVLDEHLDRPPRVVLIPMGQLARVPWSAARRRDGTYAVQLAAFSQTPSARMLCRSAAADPVPLTPVGLFVGDPRTDAPELRAARREAYAIHRSFYLGGRYVGRRPDNSESPSGTGAREDVERWLTSAAPGAGAVLHLACHGFVQPDARTSYLLLAGGTRLTAEELIRLMDTGQGRAVALVVLAACRTAHTISGYDEAYSLGTAFLAGGARSVLSTQWSIPDRDTSVLMYMFHHHLMRDRLPVWEALRRAQLWMLDPARELPAGMPARLRDELDGTDPAAVVSWAGFVHSGQ